MGICLVQALDAIYLQRAFKEFPEVDMCMHTVKLGLEGPPGPGQGLCRWPLQAPHGKGWSKFQTLWPLASRSRGARAGVRALPKNPKESSDFAALLKRIVAKKAFECIGQINLSL